MPTKHSVFDVEFKALKEEDSGDEGQFEAIVSVFNNVDVQGDRVMPGAFDQSLAEWRAKGAPIPVIWSHEWGNPQAHIGVADPNDVEEVEKGLKVKGQIDLDNPFAGQVYKLMKRRSVGQFSFAYDIVKEKRGKDGANELQVLNLIEVGPTLRGVNPDTELLAVKSDLEAAAAKCDVQHPELAAARATESELRGAIDTLQAEVDRLRGLLPSTEDSDDEKHEVEDEASGKSSDDVNRLARLAIQSRRR